MALSLFAGSHLPSDSNPQIQKELIHLIGGKDEMGNNLSSVDEFNTKDMCVFESDWKLKCDISSFSAATGHNILYIAGGVSKHPKTGKLIETNKVFTISFDNPAKAKKKQNLVELGRFPGSNFKYFMQELPPMNQARSEFALVLDKTRIFVNNDFNLFAIGGCNQEGILDSIEKYQHITKQWNVVYRFGQELGTTGLKAHQAVSLPDCILIVGGFDGEKITEKVWKFDP